MTCLIQKDAVLCWLSLYPRTDKPTTQILFWSAFLSMLYLLPQSQKRYRTPIVFWLSPTQGYALKFGVVPSGCVGIMKLVLTKTSPAALNRPRRFGRNTLPPRAGILFSAKTFALILLHLIGRTVSLLTLLVVVF
jgi:hypothetical protein